MAHLFVRKFSTTQSSFIGHPAVNVILVPSGWTLTSRTPGMLSPSGLGSPP